MKYCPITYQPISSTEKYSEEGLKLLSRQIKTLNDLPYSAQEQREEAQVRASKLSIQGVQSKLSAQLDVKNSVFRLVERKGSYILKPQSYLYSQLPENEDLSMRLAALVNIEVPLHGLVHSKDSTFTYFIKRFDRRGHLKLALEDFAQLSGENRDTKYDSSMEKVVTIINKFCSFPVLNRIRLFERSIFCFLIGNEDMHLKNFSLITRDGRVELSPAYDLLNSSIALKNPAEEFALPIRGKRSNLRQSDFIEYFGVECLQIAADKMDEIMSGFFKALPEWERLINISFLSQKNKTAYLKVIHDRTKRLGL